MSFNSILSAQRHRRRESGMGNRAGSGLAAHQGQEREKEEESFHSFVSSFNGFQFELRHSRGS